MQQLAGQFRDRVRQLARFGAMTVFAVIVLTACYTDLPVTPTATPAATLAVPTNAPPSTQAAEEPPPGGGGEEGGGGGEEPPGGGDGGGGGGGGASPEASIPTPIPTAARLVGSPPTGGTRTPASPVTGTRTPTKTGGTSQIPPTKAPTTRAVPPTRAAGGVTMPAGGVTKPAGGVTKPAGGVTMPAGGGTVTPRTGVTMPAGGVTVTSPTGVTMPAGVTVSAEAASPETVPSEVTGSPETEPSEVTTSPTTTGTILITKRENFEAALLPGACFVVMSGGDVVVAQACDNGDGDGNAEPAMIAITAPPGSYVLREITAPAGYMPAADMQVDVAEGATTALDVIDHLIPSPGSILVEKIDPAGTPVSGACFAVMANGETVVVSCDNGEGDGDDREGMIRIGVDAGSYEVVETPPAGYLPTAVSVLVSSGTETAVQVVNQPAETVEASPSSETVETGYIVASIVGEDGATPFDQSCLTFTGPATYQVCDKIDPNGVDTGDQDPTAGAIEIDGVLPGEYTLTVTLPEGYETVEAPQTVVVESAGFAPVMIVTRQIAVETNPSETTGSPTTEEQQPGLVIVSFVLEDGSPLVGRSCLELTGNATYAACDNEEGDFEPTEGVIELDGVLAGEYAVTVTLPEGYEVVDAPPSVVVEPETLASVAIVVREIAVETTPSETTGSPTTAVEQYGLVIASFALEDGSPMTGACLELAGNATYAICDNGEGDVEPTEGTLELDAVPIGDYTVTVTPPEGYELTGDIPSTIRVEADQLAQLTVTFRAVTQPSTTGTVRIDKVDSLDGVSPIGGACFELRGDNGTYPVCDDDGSDADEMVGDDNTPGVIVIANVVAGDYTLVETQTPEGRVAGPDQPVRVDVDQIATVAVANGTPVPPPSLGVLVVTKVDATDGTTLLGGACFLVTASDGQTVESCDDDGDGLTRFEGLAAGDYTVSETRAPEGYQPAPEQPVTVLTGEEAALTFADAPNAPETGALSLIVQDETGQPIADACFDLTGPQTLSICDNGEGDVEPAPGLIVIQNLMPGDYTVTQTQATAGYNLTEPLTVTVTVAVGPEPATLTVVNVLQPVEPTGVDLPSPVVYSDDAGRLWLLRPGDTEPYRLDADDLKFDPSMDPVFSFDRTWVVFLVSDPNAPAANMRWVKLEDLSGGAVDFGSVGTPRLVSWVPERSDTLIISTELPTGGFNVYLFASDLSQPPVPLFADDALPSQINAIIPAPVGPTVALQVTDAGGDPDTYLVNTSDPNAPVVTSIGPNEGSTPDQFIAWSLVGDRLLLRSGTEPPLVSMVDLAGTATPLGTEPLFDGDANIGTAPQWSADGGWIAAFNGDPTTGGQLVIWDGAGNPACDPIPDVIAADWSPVESLLWTLVATPDQPLRLVTIGTDCAQQERTTLDAPFDVLRWSPNGSALALIDHNDGGTTVSLWIGDQLVPVDTVAANLGLADVLGWSPGGEMLALFTSAPTVSIWVAIPGETAPVAIKGSTLPEGAAYVTRVWWGGF